MAYGILILDASPNQGVNFLSSYMRVILRDVSIIASIDGFSCGR